MKLQFKKGGIVHDPLNFWELKDGNIVAIYQGNRGANPELDYIIKYKTQKSRLRAPSHTHWIVDLIVKSENSPKDISDFMGEWIDIYERTEPFKSDQERKEYQLIHKEYFEDKYGSYDYSGAYSMEFLSTLLELFVKCEKQSPGAFMFKNLLMLVKDFCDGKKDFYQVVSYSKRV